MARGARIWERVLAAVDAGETQGDVAARFGVSVSAIQYWRRKRGRVAHAEFLPVRVTSVAHPRIELEAGGVIVRLPESVALEYVADLVRALRSC